MPDAQDPNHSVVRVEPVQGEITACATRNNELPPFTVDFAADERMIGKDAERLSNSPQRGPGGAGRSFEKVLDDAFEIAQRFGRIDYFSHRTGLGLRVRFPATLACR